MRLSPLRSLFGGIRDLWIAIGIALAAFLFLEWAYVGQLAARRTVFGSELERELREPGHPYAGEAWYPTFLEARESTREKYDPWRGFWAYPTASPFLNVDSAGYRRTVPRTPTPPARQVYLLGASAMWGFTARDSLTIPSLIAAGLRDAGFTDVGVVNLAQPGYTFSHELATLTLEIQRRGPPTVAAFFNGINDIRTTQLNGEPGHAFFEARFGRLYEVEAKRGMLGAILTMGERSRLVGRLGQALGMADPWLTLPQEPEHCPALGAHYQRVARHVLGLAAEWGFDVLFIQQPNHAATRKVLTPFERSFIGPEWHVRYTRECSDAIDSSMVRLGDGFRSYTRMFDGSGEAIFLDRFGHVTEAANRTIAQALIREIVARLTAPGPAQAP